MPSGWLPLPLLPLFAVLGLILGSFVTALSYRLPRGESVAHGRSRCTACGTTLQVRDLIPVLSWITNRGVCRHCGSRISWRYPAIELTMAGLFLVAVLQHLDPKHLVFILAVTPVMVALAVIDFEHRRLPNPLLGLLAVFALAWRMTTDANLIAAAISAALVFVAALTIDRVARRFGQPGLGLGDAKLIAIMGFALSPIVLLGALAAAGLLTTLAGLLLRRELKTSLPFAPALLLAFWVGSLMTQFFAVLPPTALGL